MTATLLYTAAFTALLLVLIVRAPRAWRDATARYSWLACLIGACAVFTLGFVLPQDALDDLLGGGNVLKLVQNILALMAFWFVAQAARIREERPRQRRGSVRSYAALLTGIAALVILFYSIRDRGTTDFYFVENHVDQLAGWGYGSLYLLMLAGISGSLLNAVRGRATRVYWLFALGAALVIVACSIEGTSLLMEAINAPFLAVRSLIANAFDVFFYPGVILITTGIAFFSASRQIRPIRLRHHQRELDRIIRVHGMDAAESGGSTVVQAVYAQVIMLRDMECSGRIVLTCSESEAVAKAERLVLAPMFGGLRRGTGLAIFSAA